MTQNIYDKAEFFENYMQLPRQVLGLDGAPEWPSTRLMLPEIKGKRIVDLGCGAGHVCRWMREQGASSVLGIDISTNMIARAEKETDDLNIQYQIKDLETLNLPEASYDLAFSSLTFHYIKDFNRLIKMIYQSLVPGGNFVFTIEHPIFMSAANPQWITDLNGRKTWPVNGYSKEGKRETDWFTKGVIKYHRKLDTTLNTLITAGFKILEIKEFAPSAEQIAKTPALLEELERPMILIISATR